MIKLKKIIALVLAAVLCFSFAACGKKSLTKDEMLAAAEEYSANDILNDSVENIVNAKQKYCDKTLLLSGTVREIKEDHIELAAYYGAEYIIDVYLGVDEIGKLKSGQSIKIVGITTDELIEKEEKVAEYIFNYNYYQMPTAYLVEDRVEITGILKGKNNSYKPAFNIQIGDSNYLRLIYFADSVDTDAFEYGQEITFSAKLICEGANNSWKYYEAEIIK